MLSLAFIVVAAVLTPSQGIFIALASTAAFLTSLAASMYVRVSSYPDPRSVVAEVSIPSSGVEGEPICIRAWVRNHSSRSIPLLELRIPIPPQLRILRGKWLTRLSLDSGEEANVEVCIEGRLGAHIVGPVEVVYRDPLALYMRRQHVFSEKSVRVYPRPLPPIALRELVVSRLGGLSRTRRRGFGTEFFGIREYLPGDEFRRIEWKAYARTGELYVKEFEHEASIHIVFLLDARTPMFVGPPGSTPFELSARAILSVAMYGARRGDNMMLMYLGDEIHGGTPFVRGGYAVAAFSEALSHVEWPTPRLIEPSRYFSPRSLGWLMRYLLPQRLPREKSMIFLFTTLFDEEEVEEVALLARRLMASGHEIHVVAPLAEIFETRGLATLRDLLYVVRSKEVIRARFRSLTLLRSIGIPAIVAGPTQVVREVIRRIELARLHL